LSWGKAHEFSNFGKERRLIKQKWKDFNFCGDAAGSKMLVADTKRAALGHWREGISVLAPGLLLFHKLYERK